MLFMAQEGSVASLPFVALCVLFLYFELCKVSAAMTVHSFPKFSIVLIIEAGSSLLHEE